MRIKRIAIRNFRRLENVTIDVENDETVFVGPNNSGKTSATAIFRYILHGKDFKIFDFSVGRIGAIDAIGNGSADNDSLPAIELDLWFSIDPAHISFGRSFSLLPNLSGDYDTVGVRMKYEARDAEKLLSDYTAAYPETGNGKRKRTLSQYLGIDQNLKRYFKLNFYSMDASAEIVTEQLLNEDEGKSLLRNLVRVDFVDAQRNIDDNENNRSYKLSAAFTAFYSKNLEQAEVAESAYKVIDDHNDKLTEHYEMHFRNLMSVIKNLGIPSINDRDLRIKSSLSPEMALRGNTELYYRDSNRDHELPEVYNGLGFKNLIYMAIQISHYHLQWMRTEQNRPLCQLIFIEEPEVHLHAQVQQAFITNMRDIVTRAASDAGEATVTPQFLVTTHSSHILDAVEFEKVRYFQRCELEGENPANVATLNASKVHNLREFQPEQLDVEGATISSADTLRFLQRYVKLTHCDLFFADAAVLVEGTVEKLLLPKMVEKAAPNLRTAYLSILEVGGAYAHRFAGLLKFLRIPYVVITDLDAVEPKGHHPACRGDTTGALTSNATLKRFFGIPTVEALLALSQHDKSIPDADCCVVFQTAVQVTVSESQCEMTPRTLEEAFAYTNFELIREGHISLGISIPDTLTKAYDAIFAHIKSPSFKKTEFALDILATTHDWTTPAYIAEGLEWLDTRLSHNPTRQSSLEN